MKNRMCKNSVYNLLVLMIVLSVSVTAVASDDGYALLIQTSPPDAGAVTPGLGVHKTAIGQTVALSAVPKQGYQFLYWLGDVSSTSGPDTTVSVDSPKLVVAVFAKADFDEELPGAGIADGQHAPGGGRGYNPIQSPGSVSPGRSFDSPSGFTFPDFPDEPDDGDIPVPGDDNSIDDIPVPGDNEVPEPATVFLLGLGSSILLKRMRK
ncbi:MAG: hypothetical protein DRP52_01805 [Planctomycetota bacterium]|nr:MAG: hypothetical protein DRP52_01805 [Planctomycetota bacterium]